VFLILFCEVGFFVDLIPLFVLRSLRLGKYSGSPISYYVFGQPGRLFELLMLEQTEPVGFWNKSRSVVKLDMCTGYLRPWMM
jgi:hypothetical protein